MVAKLFTKPFGVAGDKTPIPNDTQVDGTVSYQTGFGADYERQLGVDPAAKNIGRQTFNELMFDVTTGLQEMQAGFGTSPYSLSLAQALPDGGYPKGALIPRLAGDGFWLCTTAANTSNPDTGGLGWVQIAAQGSFYAIDTGVANTYSCVFSPALTARSETQPLTVRIKFTNTGASTVNDGLGTVPLVGLSQVALQGGEVFANGIAVLQWVAAISSYVVVYATGGAAQVASATKSLQAVNAGQIQVQSVTAFTTTGTATAQVLTPIPAISGYATSQRFNVTFNVASGLNPTINVSGQGAKFLKQYDATGAKIAASFAVNQNSDIVYDGTDYIILDPLPVAVISNIIGIQGAFKNLVGSATGTNAAVSYTADELIVENASNQYQVLRPVNLSALSFANAGANGLDAGVGGSQTASTWYSVWVIWNGSTTAGLLSTSATAPTMPSGYTHKARVGWVRTDGTANKYPLSFVQYGRHVKYKVASGSNLTSLPSPASGVNGSTSAPTWIAFSISAVVPVTASIIDVLVVAVTTGVTMVAPNAAYGNRTSTVNPPPLAAWLAGSTSLVQARGTIAVEQAGTMYYAADSAGCGSFIVGWEDNL